MLRGFKYTSIPINEAWIMMSHQFYLEKHVSHTVMQTCVWLSIRWFLKHEWDFSYNNMYLNVINMIMTMLLIALRQLNPTENIISFCQYESSQFLFV